MRHYEGFSPRAAGSAAGGLVSAAYGMTRRAASKAQDRSWSTPGPILLLGAPGVGKGTQAKELMAEWWHSADLDWRSSFAKHRDRAPRWGAGASTSWTDGELVPDELVNQMVAERLSRTGLPNGYVLDGFPRTLAQAEWLDGHLARKPGRSHLAPVIAVSIQVGYNQFCGDHRAAHLSHLRPHLQHLLRSRRKWTRSAMWMVPRWCSAQDDTDAVICERHADLRGADCSGGGALP